jgi:hypothetical protein
LGDCRHDAPVGLIERLGQVFAAADCCRPALAAGTGAAHPWLEQRPWSQILAVEFEEIEDP